MLFMLFANDLSLHVPDGVTTVQFADDTQLLVTGKKHNLPAMISLMEETLESVFQWSCNNDMKINAAKTQMIVFGTPAMLKSLPAVTLRFNGSDVTESAIVKNLGLHMDRNLNFKAHIDELTSRCTGILIALSHVGMCCCIRHHQNHSAGPRIISGALLFERVWLLWCYPNSPCTEDRELLRAGGQRPQAQRPRVRRNRAARLDARD